MLGALRNAFMRRSSIVTSPILAASRSALRTVDAQTPATAAMWPTVKRQSSLVFASVPNKPQPCVRRSGREPRKSNEIPAIQKLLQEPGLAGHIATADAIHCQKNLRPPLADAHLIVQLKDNQPTLCQKVEALCEAAKSRTNRTAGVTSPSARTPRESGKILELSPGCEPSPAMCYAAASRKRCLGGLDAVLAMVFSRER